jgi:hypothetical protein
MELQSTDAMPDNSTIATNLVRRPVDGVVVTSSGRCIPQPPWIFLQDPESQAAYDGWLIEQGKAEARDLNEAMILAKLDGLRAEDLDQVSRQLLSDFLFGLSDPRFEARPLHAVPLPEMPAGTPLTP